MNKDILKQPLSDLDIRNLSKDPIQIVPYDDLINYNTIEDLLNPTGQVVILYLNQVPKELEDKYKYFGHYTCVFYSHVKNTNKPNKPFVTSCIEFFDPYGLFPDDQLHFSNVKFRQENNMDYPYLVYLLNKSKLPIEYNPFKFQKMDGETSTCGRWCTLRMNMKQLDIDEFTKLIKQFKRKTNKDARI